MQPERDATSQRRRTGCRAWPAALPRVQVRVNLTGCTIGRYVIPLSSYLLPFAPRRLRCDGTDRANACLTSAAALPRSLDSPRTNTLAFTNGRFLRIQGECSQDDAKKAMQRRCSKPAGSCCSSLWQETGLGSGVSVANRSSQHPSSCRCACIMLIHVAAMWTWTCT